MSIKYIDDSFAGSFSESEYESLKQLLRLDIPDFDLDSDYLNHIRKYNGGRPVDKYFTARNGNVWSIDVFLNFVDTTKVDSIAAGHNVLAFFEEVEDRTSVHFLPFAIVGGGNLLCFDYTIGKQMPAVVLWYLESSKVESIADSFTEFLAMLSDESP